MLISIFGCTGYVGMHLVPFLAQAAPDIQIRAMGQNLMKLDFLKNTPNVVSTHVYSHGNPLLDLVEGTSACLDLSYGIKGIPSEVIDQAYRHGRNLVEAAHKSNTAQVIIVGSIASYGEPRIRHPWKEAPLARHLRSNTIYGHSKASVEIAAENMARKRSVNLTILRAGHILGPGANLLRAIAGNILIGTPQGFNNMTAPANMTDLESLLATLLRLSKEPIKGIRVGNHVSLSDVSLDDIVAFISEEMSLTVEMTLPTPPRRRPRAQIIGFLRAHQDRALYMQSYIGRYDFGLSAAIIRRMKRALSGHLQRQTYNGIESSESLNALYLSDLVPHTAEICGPGLTNDSLIESLAPISRWICDAGYAELKSL